MALNRSASRALKYQTGFGNTFESEAESGALPARGNNPKNCPLGLYAEQLSGTAFAVPRTEQQRTWFYRILPSVQDTQRTLLDPQPPHVVSDFSQCIPSVNNMRWQPFKLDEVASGKTNFIHGLYTVCGSGSVSSKTGFAIHIYLMNADMKDTSFVNADGDYLFVPQEGGLLLTTECGRMEIQPGEIAVIPRGMLFAVELLDEAVRGYLLEIFEGHFKLPDLGPIGANGLANPRDFEYPTAWYEDKECRFTHVSKFQGRFFECIRPASPFDVVAWHGNYLPFKYDLAKFCPVNAVTFDHSDPSILTVLTVPTPTPGVAVVDFLIFPPRWLVAEETFRPPYFHRNCMNEFMGSIRGVYDAKKGFSPGCCSLHVCMTPHGPDKPSYLANIDPKNEAPVRLPDSDLAFMFESHAVPWLTPFAVKTPFLEKDYISCWTGFERNFKSKSAS